MASRLLAVLALLVAAPFVRAEPLDLTNAKNSEAATVLIARFFENIGLDVFDKGKETLGLKFGGYTMLAIPYFVEDEACRLNLHIGFKGRKSNIGNAKLLALLNEINETYNYAVISMDKNGDLSLRFTLVFDRKLDAKLVHRWLRYVERQADGLVYEFNERLLPYQAPSEK